MGRINKFNVKYKVIELVFLFVIAFSLYFFMIGLHNVDLSFNALKISYDKEINLFYDSQDCNEFTCRSFMDLYLLGFRLMQSSMSILVFSCVLFFLYKSSFKLH